MKKVKTTTIVILLFLSASIHAQSKDSLSIKYSVFEYPSLTFKSKNSYFKHINYFSKKASAFSIYNKTTGLNDNYLLTSKNFGFIYSNKLLENNFSLQKIDSFNPYGSPDIGTSIFNGLWNSIFNR